jgi:DNA processing protein
MLAVVGTRRPSPYGLAAAERLATDLALAGLTISSGMARGIDTSAHKATLAAGGKTVAVFGCGVDICYPAENRKLAQDIARDGLVLSEFPMGAPAYPQNFPLRNRIVAGMSVGVLVVEGAQYSGSAITARLAMDQGREVFAVPGNITSKQSWGPNLLIKQGAKLVQDWNDVLEELSPADRLLLQASSEQRGLAFVEPSANEAPVEALGRKILELLAFDQPTQLDQLIDRLDGQTSSEIIAALFDLELQGAVKQLPGKLYLRAWQ